MRAIRRVSTRICCPWCPCVRPTKQPPGGSGLDHAEDNTAFDDIPQQQMKTLFNFEAIQEGDLSFKEGEKLLVTIEKDSDWWEAVNQATGEVGQIPRNYVTPDNDDKESQTWWFDIDRHEAEALLMLPGNPQGTFLVRPSRDGKSSVLSIRNFDSSSSTNIDIRHYRVRTDDADSVFIVRRCTFATVNKLIEHHQQNADRLCHRLVAVCPRRPELIPFKQLEVNRAELQLTKKLGAGKFGEVWKGTWRNSMEVAVKQLTPGQMTTDAFVSEAKVLHRLRHRHLVRLLGVCTLKEPIYIIMELLPHSALNDYLRSDAGRQLDYYVLVYFCTQIADGMEYVESEHYIHRDLRSANILVGDNDTVKIADLGLARLLSEDYYNPTTLTAFPVKWTAPEAANDSMFSIKSDVWSFGVLVWEILTYGRVPYMGMTSPETLQEVSNGYRLKNPDDTHHNGRIKCPPNVYETMMRCWSTEPKDRPSFAELHNFFAELEPYHLDNDAD